MFSLLGRRVRRRGRELVTRYLRPGISEETTGSPKFLGNLDCPFARVLTDAGRTAHTRPLRCSSMAPGPPGAKAPTKGLSTPNSTAFGLAVYASPGSLPHHDARLASGCWSGSTGWAFHPQDSDERFQDCVSYISILLSQALLGTMGATDASSSRAPELVARSEKWSFDETTSADGLFGRKRQAWKVPP